jgi:transcriptional regulator with XRE-family HTH domain
MQASAKVVAMSKPLTEQLRDAIRKSGMTQREIAKRAGVSESLLSRFMANTSGLHSATLDALGAVLGLRLVSTRTRKRRT